MDDRRGEREVWTSILDAVVEQWRQQGLSLEEFEEILSKTKRLLLLIDKVKEMADSVTDTQTPTILPKLSTVLSPEKVYQHTCGSSAFFAWGIKLITQESVGNHPKLQDMPGDSEVMICAECLGAVVIMGAVMYDASEFISKEEVNNILLYGQARQQATPLKAMDI